MKKDNYNNINKNEFKKAEQDYLYYSKALKEPFASIEELKEAEEAYYAKLKAKEDKAIAKKADAKKVEEAFVTLNEARRTYKEELAGLTEEYSKNLVKLKENFEAARDEVKANLANAEDAYSNAIKCFTDKYPEGYHLTLKDGDFETTISGSSRSSEAFDTNRAFQMLDWLFNL